MKFAKSLAIAAALILTSKAHAIFDAQLSVGQRNAKLENSTLNVDEKLTGTDVGIGLHLYPIPKVPVGIGMFYNSVSYDTDENSTSFPMKSFTGTEYGPEIAVNLPIPGTKLAPFLKVGYILSGDYIAKLSTNVAADTSLLGTAKGNHISLGLTWSPIPLVGIFFGGDLGQETLTLTHTKTASTKTAIDPEQEYDFNSTALYLGLSVGI